MLSGLSRPDGLGLEDPWNAKDKAKQDELTNPNALYYRGISTKKRNFLRVANAKGITKDTT